MWTDVVDGLLSAYDPWAKDTFQMGHLSAIPIIPGFEACYELQNY